MSAAGTALALLAQGSGFNIWHYRLRERSGAGLVTDGFLNPYGEVLNAGDLVLFSDERGDEAGMAVVRGAGPEVDLAAALVLPERATRGATELRADPDALSVLGYANGFTLWHHRSDDPPEACEKLGYWDEARTLLLPGDMVFGRYRQDGRTVWGYAVVTTNDEDGVTVARLTGFV